MCDMCVLLLAIAWLFSGKGGHIEKKECIWQYTHPIKLEQPLCTFPWTFNNMCCTFLWALKCANHMGMY